MHLSTYVPATEKEVVLNALHEAGSIAPTAIVVLVFQAKDVTPGKTATHNLEKRKVQTK